MKEKAGNHEEDKRLNEHFKKHDVHITEGFEFGDKNKSEN